MKTSEINFKVTLDENNIPLDIIWEANDAGEKSSCKSLMITLWDAKENNTPHPYSQFAGKSVFGVAGVRLLT
jgi:hypothetical protein